MSINSPDREDSSDENGSREAPTRERNRSVARFFAYLGAIWFLLLIPDFAFRWSLNQIFPSWTDYDGLRRQPSLYAKIAQYESGKNDFDLVFLGDSRTFTDIAPDAIDEALGTHSINLATWGNWFPTQYASNQEILPKVPDGTRVVWSLGHINFRRINEQINSPYHVGFSNLPTYLHWGFALSTLRDNLTESVPGLALYTRRAYLREHVRRILDRRIWRKASPANAPAAEPGETFDSLKTALASDPAVLDVDVIRNGEQVTSLAAFKSAGNYIRYEIDPAFFRSKQNELAQVIETIETDRFVADPEYWNNFIGILDQFEEYGIELIVNEFEEAPYHYDDPKNARLYRDFMNEVRRLVESRGVPFIRVDFSKFGNEHYFDFNHLNSDGVEIYTDLFTKELSAYLGGS